MSAVSVATSAAVSKRSAPAMRCTFVAPGTILKSSKTSSLMAAGPPRTKISMSWASSQNWDSVSRTTSS